MPRPVKWSRDLHPIRDRARRSRTETWARKDIEDLFSIGPSSAQNLMKAIGEVQAVGGTHFVDRSSLLEFLDAMIAAESVEEALQLRLGAASPLPRPKPLRIRLPPDLRRVTLTDLPANVHLKKGEVRITGGSALEILEGLATLARAMENDLDRILHKLEPPPPRSDTDVDAGLRALLQTLRGARKDSEWQATASDKEAH